MAIDWAAVQKAFGTPITDQAPDGVPWGGNPPPSGSVALPTSPGGRVELTPDAAPATPPAPAGPTTDQLSSLSILQNTFKKFGLDDSDGSLSKWALGLITSNATSDNITNQLNDPATTGGAAYAKRFPEIAQRRALNKDRIASGKPPLSPLSATDIMGLEDSYGTVLSQYGSLGKYVSADMVSKWIVGDSSPSEVKSRLDAVYSAVQGEPLEVRHELSRITGSAEDPGAAMAYYLDPDKSLAKIQETIQAGEIGGASVRTGYGLLSPEELTQLAQQGITAGQAQKGFGNLNNQRELFAPLPGEAGSDISQADRLGAEFGGNTAAQEAFAKRAAARKAAFSGSSQFATTSQGVVGLAENT